VLDLNAALQTWVVQALHTSVLCLVDAEPHEAGQLLRDTAETLALQAAQAATDNASEPASPARPLGVWCYELCGTEGPHSATANLLAAAVAAATAGAAAPAPAAVAAPAAASRHAPPAEASAGSAAASNGLTAAQVLTQGTPALLGSAHEAAAVVRAALSVASAAAATPSTHATPSNQLLWVRLGRRPDSSHESSSAQQAAALAGNSGWAVLDLLVVPVASPRCAATVHTPAARFSGHGCWRDLLEELLARQGGGEGAERGG
jgi:hypothetical protein